ncbi:glycosyltransferase family 2 protein [Segetibacter sp. 3557_3]|uniref:glycosyltransferase family 2 protein n=1 Tax=Segetibacter sp. 3557_3 TaxID=2547429 RepID=UPI00105894ED|nr:glycosyltransferase family 2 protein [Segetibacter sp. 3557_3]TDH24645.1 glycosyltransferase family 2 protein [Segetibacter sp. 3557_3]
MSTLIDMTIVIPVRNEEKNLAGCLKAIGSDFATEIVVIDSNSTDLTKEIAINHGARFLNFDWNGEFPKKRNWYLRNHAPNTKWILFLDADEYLTESFKTELRRRLSSEQKCGYWLRYSIYFMGKKLQGGYPLRKLALFHTSAGEYEKINENNWSKLDMEIHEHPVIMGDLGEIKSQIDHQDYRGIASYITKHVEYAAWEAERFLKTHASSSSAVKWTWKQKLKYRIMRSVWIGPIFFFGSFFFLGGFRDGSRGLAFAILKMSYFNQIYCRIQEKSRQDAISK